MWILQVILLILKLWPFGEALCFWGIDLQQPLINGSADPSVAWHTPYIHFYPSFHAISWAIMLIPSYIIITRWIASFVENSIKEKMKKK